MNYFIYSCFFGGGFSECGRFFLSLRKKKLGKSERKRVRFFLSRLKVNLLFYSTLTKDEGRLERHAHTHPFVSRLSTPSPGT